MKPKKGGTDIEMDEPMKNPLQLVKELVLLIAEARTPDLSVKGRIEGPHCPAFRGRAVHKCNADKTECIRASQFCLLAQRLWLNNIPVCLDILLFPDCIHGQKEATVTEGTVTKLSTENVVLIERWTIDGSKKRHDDYLTSSMLIQAVRSYLHFSQISSWLYSTGGKLQGILAYRVYAPGEMASLDFSQTPDIHSFPVCHINLQNIRVQVASLQRQPSVPDLICIQEQLSGNISSQRPHERCNAKINKADGAETENMTECMTLTGNSVKGCNLVTNSSKPAYACGCDKLVKINSLHKQSAQLESTYMCDAVNHTHFLPIERFFKKVDPHNCLQEVNRQMLSDAEVLARKIKNKSRTEITDGGDDFEFPDNVLCSTIMYNAGEPAIENEHNLTPPDIPVLVGRNFISNLDKTVNSNMNKYPSLLNQELFQETSCKEKSSIRNSVDNVDYGWGAFGNNKRRVRVTKTDAEKDSHIEQRKKLKNLDAQELKSLVSKTNIDYGQTSEKGDGHISLGEENISSHFKKTLDKTIQSLKQNTEIEYSQKDKCYPLNYSPELQNIVTFTDTSTIPKSVVQKEVVPKEDKSFNSLFHESNMSQLSVNISKSLGICEDSDDIAPSFPSETFQPTSVSQSLVNSVTENSFLTQTENTETSCKLPQPSHLSQCLFRMSVNYDAYETSSGQHLKTSDCPLPDNDKCVTDVSKQTKDAHSNCDCCFSQARSRRIFEENLLPLVSYDADSDSFRKVEELYSSHILHSPKVLFSCDVPSVNMINSRKCIDFVDTFETEFFKSKISDLVDPEAIGKYMSSLALLSCSSPINRENKDEAYSLGNIEHSLDMVRHNVQRDPIIISSSSGLFLKQKKIIHEVGMTEADTELHSLSHHAPKKKHGISDNFIQEIHCENLRECTVKANDCNQTKRYLNFTNSGPANIKSCETVSVCPSAVNNESQQNVYQRNENLEQDIIENISTEEKLISFQTQNMVLPISPTLSLSSSSSSSSLSSSSTSSVQMLSGSASLNCPDTLSTLYETVGKENISEEKNTSFDKQKLVHTCWNEVALNRHFFNEEDIHFKPEARHSSVSPAHLNRQSSVSPARLNNLSVSPAHLNRQSSVSPARLNRHSSVSPARLNRHSTVSPAHLNRQSPVSPTCLNRHSSVSARLNRQSSEFPSSFPDTSMESILLSRSLQTDNSLQSVKVHQNKNLCHNKHSTTGLSEVVMSQPLPQDNGDLNNRPHLSFEFNSCDSCESNQAHHDLNVQLSDSESPLSVPIEQQCHAQDMCNLNCDLCKFTTNIPDITQENTVNDITDKQEVSSRQLPTAIELSTKVAESLQENITLALFTNISANMNVDRVNEDVQNIESDAKSCLCSDTFSNTTLSGTNTSNTELQSFVCDDTEGNSSKYEFINIIPESNSNFETVCNTRGIILSTNEILCQSPEENKMCAELKEQPITFLDFNSISAMKCDNENQYQKLHCSSFEEQPTCSYTVRKDPGNAEVFDIEKNKFQCVQMQNGNIVTQHSSFKTSPTRWDSTDRCNNESDDNDVDFRNGVVFFLSEPENRAVKTDSVMSQQTTSLKQVANPSENYKVAEPTNLSARVNQEIIFDYDIKKRSDLNFDGSSRAHSYQNDDSSWSSVPPHRTVSTPDCINREAKINDRNSPSHTSVIQQQICDNKGQTGLRKMAAKSASVIFNNRTGLPTQSSPAPLKRKSSGRFDYDVSLLNTRAIKNAFSCSKLASDVCVDDGDENKKQTLSTSAPASTNCLLGNFEESILNGRIDPVGTVDGFTAEIGASGSFCPKHIHLPVSAFFFSLSDDNAPSPYLGHINLESVGRKGYHIPRKGTVQVTLFNPNKTVVKMFVVVYDLSDMPTSSRTFIRQRTVYCPIDKDHTAPSYLRYLIHLRCASSQSGKIYLHTDIRLIFARHKLDIDGKTIPYELKSYTEGPQNPKYSPKK